MDLIWDFVGLPFLFPLFSVSAVIRCEVRTDWKYTDVKTAAVMAIDMYGRLNSLINQVEKENKFKMQ